MPKSPSLVGLTTGALIAAFIACAAPQSKGVETSARPAPVPREVSPPPGGSSRDQITALDTAISQDMAKLELARPPAPVDSCVEHCPQQMGAAVTATATPPPDCRPGNSTKCTDTCALKESICKSAGNICRIATDLGGNDSYANDACNRGNASCDAAKQRCCGCL